MRFQTLASVILTACFLCLCSNFRAISQPDNKPSIAASASEARTRAMLLHEMVQGSLQVMHRDFFDDEESRAIPSASLEDVFLELDKCFGVKLKWLIVETDVLNHEHQAKTEFEKAAVKVLESGKPFAEEIRADRYEFAGAIRLSSQCLKCHVKLRTNTEDRTAGLVISMPLALAQEK